MSFEIAAAGEPQPVGLNTVNDSLNFRRLSIPEAKAIAQWRYAGEYSMYDVPDAGMESSVRYMTDPDNRYFGAYEDDELVGFCSIGADGQVSGGNYDETAVDIGAGMRPDLIGRRRGSAFLKSVVGFVESKVGRRRLRATIASWNERALRVAGGAGFLAQTTFVRSDGTRFTVLVRGIPNDQSTPPNPPL